MTSSQSGAPPSSCPARPSLAPCSASISRWRRSRRESARRSPKTSPKNPNRCRCLNPVSGPRSASPRAKPRSPPILDAAEVERARAAPQAEWAAAAAAAHEADAEERKVWNLPPLNLLDPMGSKHEKLQEEVKHNIGVIEGTLASFGVAA